MTTAVAARPREPLGSRLVRGVTRAPLHLVLVVIAVFWLVPTFGLAVASLRSAPDNAASGWWNALAEPSQLTFDNYQALFDNDDLMGAWWNTVFIAVPATLLVVALAALAAYAFAWIPFPGSDWLFLLVVALLVVPIQVALIPVAQLFGDLGIYGDLIGVVLFQWPSGCRSPSSCFATSSPGSPGDAGGRPHRRRRRAADLHAGGAARGHPRHRLAGHLPVPLDLERPPGRPGVRRQRQRRSPWPSARRPASSATTSTSSPSAFISLIVPLIVFFAFQRYFVQGILAGSEK